MDSIVISGTGLYTPPEKITNQELVHSFNTYVNDFNQAHQSQIDAGQISPLLPSSQEFIEKASGIKARHVMNKAGILDPKRMKPANLERNDEALSVMADVSVQACKMAFEQSRTSSQDIDFVLVACSAFQRPYPALSIEIQQALGVSGYAFDMNVACSSATFAIQTACNALKAGSAKGVLIVNPELCTAQLNFRDRDSHFIFGDACTAMVLQRQADSQSEQAFVIKNTQLRTQFSNNIRNNFGFLNRTQDETPSFNDKLFYQQGRKVFKEVVPMVVETLQTHLQSHQIPVENIKRFWLHQANRGMNELICKKLTQQEPNQQLAPIILDEYANTSSAGSIIAFHQYKDDLNTGDLGLLSSFGAGYSIGSVVLEKV